MNESHCLCVSVPVCPAVLVPVKRWSGQVECWWGQQVVVSWHSGTATEPASEPRSAGESPAAAHSHCEPRPCLQQGDDVKGQAFVSWSVSKIRHVCMEFQTRRWYELLICKLLMHGFDLSWEVYVQRFQPVSDLSDQDEPQIWCNI